MSIVIVVFTGRRTNAMRRMIIQLDQGSIRQFRCSDCDWVFHVQQPVTPEISVAFQRSYAQRWFAAHRCPSGRWPTQARSWLEWGYEKWNEVIDFPPNDPRCVRGPCTKNLLLYNCTCDMLSTWK